MDKVERWLITQSPEALEMQREELSIHEAAHAAAYTYYGIPIKYLSVEGLDGTCACIDTPVVPSKATEHAAIGLIGDYAIARYQEGESTSVPFFLREYELKTAKERGVSEDYDTFVTFRYLEMAQESNPGATLDVLYYDAEERALNILEEQWEAIERLSRYLNVLGYMTGEQVGYILSEGSLEKEEEA